MAHKTLLDKQVELDGVVSQYQADRPKASWNAHNAAQVASCIDGFLHDEQGRRHRVTIVTRLEGDQPVGRYKAMANGDEVELRNYTETARAYPLLNVSRVEFLRSEMPGMIKPTQTDGELTPMTDAEARRMIGN